MISPALYLSKHRPLAENNNGAPLQDAPARHNQHRKWQTLPKNPTKTIARAATLPIRGPHK